MHNNRCGQKNLVSTHAEINTLMKALKSYDKKATLKSDIIFPPSKLYVVRILSHENEIAHRPHKFGISKPCKHCQENLFKHNVTKVYYTDYIDNIEVLCEMHMNKEYYSEYYSSNSN